SFTQGPGNIVYKSSSRWRLWESGKRVRWSGGVFRFSISRSDESPFALVKSSDQKRTEIDIPKLIVDQLHADRSATECRRDRDIAPAPLESAVAVDATHFESVRIFNGRDGVGERSR